MIDIFDVTKPVFVVAWKSGWALATHRQVIPTAFFLGSLLTLGLLSYNMRHSDITNCVTQNNAYAHASIKAFIIPCIKILSVSADDLSVTIDLSPPRGLQSNGTDASTALSRAVTHGEVNMALICGDMWFMSRHATLGKALVLTSQANTVFPIGARKFPVGAKDWASGTQWDAGAGALVIAFKDIHIMTT